MSSYASLAHLAWVAVAVNGAFALVLLVITTVAIVFIKRTGMEEIERAEKTLPTTLRAIAYSKMPIGAIVVIAEHKGIDMKEMVAAYAKEAMERKAIVQSTFNDDDVTSRFLLTDSKFMKHGYEGEELLLNLFDSPKYRQAIGDPTNLSQQPHSAPLSESNGGPGKQQHEITHVIM